MDYPTRERTPQPSVKVEPRPRQSLDAWINDLCVVGPDPRLTGPYRGECIDGFVWRDVKGYSTLFACPVCDRCKRDLYPYQFVPNLKKWMGSYSKYTEHEMAQRRLNRVEVVESLRNRAGRVPTFDTEEVCKPF